MPQKDRSTELLESYWKSLQDWEASTNSHSKKALAGYENAFRICLEAGVLVPCLGKIKQNSHHLRLSALFLKRSLNDVRCIWLLTQSGYTSQAASIAASLFENTHVVKLVAGNEQRATLFNIKNLAEKLPWRIDEMCRELAKDELSKGQSKLLLDEIWKLDYSKYSWFCEIKHNTLRVALHDAGTVASEDGFALMAAPDKREEYTGMKKLLCIFSLMEASAAIEAFATATGVGSEASDEIKYRAMMQKLDDFLTTEITNRHSLKIPFGLKDTAWGQKNLRPLNCLKKPT